MNREILLSGLVIAIIFLLGVEVLAAGVDQYSLQSPEDEFVIVIKPLPKSKLQIIENKPESSSTLAVKDQVNLPAPEETPNYFHAVTTTAAAENKDDQEFKITIRPIAEIRQ